MTPFVLGRRPSVAMITLLADRQRFVPRLVRNFTSQAYPNLVLIVLDTGNTPAEIPDHPRIVHIRMRKQAGDCIGRLRNEANDACHADVLAHADSDDWSHPARILEQVAQLEHGEVTGYNELLFWDSTEAQSHGAWVYKGAPNYSPGAALCYWRYTWQRKFFPELNTGEDTKWQSGLKMAPASGLPSSDPRMVCEIHGGNTTTRVVWNLDVKTGALRSCEEWRRAPEYDDRAAEVMSL